MKELFFQPIERFTNSIVAESAMPSQGYESTVKVFGARIAALPTGEYALIESAVSRADQVGDKLLRTADYHSLESVGRFVGWRVQRLRRKLRNIWRGGFQSESEVATAPEQQPLSLRLLDRLFAPAPRYRKSLTEWSANIERLGLSDVYQTREVEIDGALRTAIILPKELPNWLNLQDIFRKDQIVSSSEQNEATERLQKTQQQQALKAATTYLREMHRIHGPIGEVLLNDFYFRESSDTGTTQTVAEPILNVPDISLNADVSVSDRAQIAYDLLDFLFDGGMKLEGGVPFVVAVMNQYFSFEDAQYAEQDEKLLRLVLRFAEKRLNFSQKSIRARAETMHNTARYQSNDVAQFQELRNAIKIVGERLLQTRQSTTSAATHERDTGL